MKIDWSKVDWEKVDKEKAEFIYREAQTVHRDIMKNHDVLNDKAFQLLALTTTILIAVSSALLSQWSVIDAAIKGAAIGFILPAFFAATSFSWVVWPRHISYSAVEPDAIMGSDYYQKPIEEMLHGAVMLSVDRLNGAHRSVGPRTKGLRVGLVLLVLSITLPFILFVTLSFSA